MKKIVIFGTSDFARLMHWYITNDTDRNVVCFCADKQYITESNFLGLPVVPFENIEMEFSPDDHEMLIAIGPSKMNDLRKRLYLQAKEKGYKIINYIHSSAQISKDIILGEGNIILEKTLIQPFSVIGNANLIWYNVSIAHNAKIGSFNTIAGCTSFSGYVTMGNNCYSGNQSMIFDHVKIDDYTLIGAGANIREATKPYSVIVPARSIVLEGKKSTDFF